MTQTLWIYVNCRLMECRKDPQKEPNDTIDIEVFEHLTGKKINWKKREFKKIISWRERGHIRLYDEQFLEGEVYKHRSGKYICTKVDNTGTALLNKLGKNMTIKSATAPFEDFWEIA